MGYHAELSPSSSHRWSECTMAINAQRGRPNKSSEDAREGTCCHQVVAEVLEDGHEDAQHYLGRKMLFWVHAESESNGEDWAENFGFNPDPCIEFLYEQIVSQEMCDACDKYINFIRQLRDDTGSVLLVEQRVPIGHITGERDPDRLDDEGKPNAFGSSDAVLVAPKVLTVVDAKFGRKKVMAYDFITPETMDLDTLEIIPPKTRMNRQLALYALGTLAQWGFLYEFEQVKVIIVQPFLNHVSEYTCTIQELIELGEWLKERAELTRIRPEYKPGSETCHFCRASGDCEAQDLYIAEMAIEGFDEVGTPTLRTVPKNRLGTYYGMLPLLETWMSDIRSRVAQEVQHGIPVMRDDGMFYKLVPGRAGARKWRNAEEAEKLMKESFRLRNDQMYDYSLISPTTAEKLAKKSRKGPAPIIGPTQWERLQELIKQTEGKDNPVIALATDSRPGLPAGSEGFDEVNPSDDLSDLF